MTGSDKSPFARPEEALSAGPQSQPAVPTDDPPLQTDRVTEPARKETPFTAAPEAERLFDPIPFGDSPAVPHQPAESDAQSLYDQPVRRPLTLTPADQGAGIPHRSEAAFTGPGPEGLFSPPEPAPFAAPDHSGHSADHEAASAPLRPVANPHPASITAPRDSGTFDHEALTGDPDALVALSVAKRFGRRTVLSDVSLALRRGEVVGLLGPNGAGKTTTFYIVCGLLKPDGGNIFLRGKKVTKLPVYRRARLGLGYLPQEASIFRGLTVEKNILAILETSTRGRKARAERLEQLLDEFSIQHIRHSPALALSGGERRRVEIARALAANPAFVLLDEPFAGVDPIAVGDIRKLVAQLKTRGIGVLITDHNVRETLSVVDRAYIIYGGRVLKHGTAAEIVADERVREVYLGDRFQL